MVGRLTRYCPIVQQFIYVDEPCPLKPPSDCNYKGQPRCPLEKEKKEKEHEQPI